MQTQKSIFVISNKFTERIGYVHVWREEAKRVRPRIHPEKWARICPNNGALLTPCVCNLYPVLPAKGVSVLHAASVPLFVKYDPIIFLSVTVKYRARADVTQDAARRHDPLSSVTLTYIFAARSHANTTLKSEMYGEAAPARWKRDVKGSEVEHK
jgi:hypothetical protein